MADAWGALAQVQPSASTLTDGYTVPVGKRATVFVSMANSGAAAMVRLSHAIAGAGDALKQYYLYDYALDANDTQATVRFTANATDVLRVYSDTGDVVFQFNGIEEDA